MADLTFERAVTSAREELSERILSNRSMSHARHVILEMYSLAIELRANVKMTSGSFNPICYDDEVVAKATKLLEVGGSIDGIVDVRSRALLSNSKIAGLLANPLIEGASLYYIDTASIADEFSHFTLVGDGAFRFEEDHELAKALLSFNQPDTVKSLLAEFEVYKQSSTLHQA